MTDIFGDETKTTTVVHFYLKATGERQWKKVIDGDVSKYIVYGHGWLLIMESPKKHTISYRYP